MSGDGSINKIGLEVLFDCLAKKQMIGIASMIAPCFLSLLKTGILLQRFRNFVFDRMRMMGSEIYRNGKSRYPGVHK